LSTLADSNTPQSALVGIATTPDLEIVFDTIKSTRKYPNLIARRASTGLAGRESCTRRETSWIRYSDLDQNPPLIREFT
jgi:hypothetical protein